MILFFSNSFGYPLLASTTVIDFLFLSLIKQFFKSLSNDFSIISNMSVLSNGRMTCASGSPKRQLYSISFGPSSVIITPIYKIPS